ncbi:hypothetical protein [Duganella fentianensis]|uniref:hypothetical protein n=1 Tax=Duganella fentianensis TaxID=2692177 RepID=UPI0032B19E75
MSQSNKSIPVTTDIVTTTTAPVEQGDHTPAPEPLTLWLLRSGTAKKVSKYGDGSISYQVLADADRTTIYITITGNNGGGYFSRERVPFDAIEACVKKCEPERPFPSKTLQSAFVGRSANNAGFMVAVLRAEDLLCPAPGRETQHAVTSDWTAWKKSALAEPGTLIQIDAREAGATPVDTVAVESEHKTTQKPPGKKKT